MPIFKKAAKFQVQFVVHQKYLRFFARCNGSYFIVDTDALCRISCCRKNGICQRNIKRNCFSHAVVQVRSGTRDGLTVGQGRFSVFHPDSLSPEGIRSVRHSRCHHGIADENHTFTSHHGEGRADNSTVNVIAVVKNPMIAVINSTFSFIFSP